MNMMKKFAVTTLAGVSLAGAFVATGTQEVKAEVQVSDYVRDEVKSKSAILEVIIAKFLLQTTLDRVGFQYLHEDFDLSEPQYYGSVMGVFESNYRDMYLGSKPTNPMSEAEFYTKRSEEHTSELQSRQYLVCR